jgi:hypothetical protein
VTTGAKLAVMTAAALPNLLQPGPSAAVPVSPTALTQRAFERNEPPAVEVVG